MTTRYEAGVRYINAYDKWSQTTNWRDMYSIRMKSDTLAELMGMSAENIGRVEAKTAQVLGAHKAARYMKLFREVQQFNEQVSTAVSEYRQEMQEARDQFLSLCFPKNDQGHYTAYDTATFTHGQFSSQLVFPNCYKVIQVMEGNDRHVIKGYMTLQTHTFNKSYVCFEVYDDDRVVFYTD